MASRKSPKVVLFDIGGVCVLSPMQGILDYEHKHHIPESWINYAIRHSSPNGHWQRLERGEIKMDADFFKGFTADLHNKGAWREYNSSFRNEKKKLKHVANPTQLGDPVSLKAEAADSTPTDQDRGAYNSSTSSSPSSSSFQNSKGRPSLSKLAKDTTIGDPVSLESEDVVVSSQSTDNQARISSSSSSTLPSQPRTSTRSDPPRIDGEDLFWTMMAASRHPDPYIFPALERLSKQSPRPILAALSNTVIFPPDHPYAKAERSSIEPGTEALNEFFFNPRTFFDVYTASAEVGMRKPAKEIYELAIKRINDFAKEKGKGDIKAEDIVFLDDIGENLKMGKTVGMRTIRVQLGKTWRAVKELEGVLGVELMDERTRRSKL